MVWLMPEVCESCKEDKHENCTETPVPYGVYGGTKCPCDHERKRKVR